MLFRWSRSAACLCFWLDHHHFVKLLLHSVRFLLQVLNRNTFLKLILFSFNGFLRLFWGLTRLLTTSRYRLFWGNPSRLRFLRDYLRLDIRGLSHTLLKVIWVFDLLFYDDVGGFRFFGQWGSHTLLKLVKSPLQLIKICHLRRLTALKITDSESLCAALNISE